MSANERKWEPDAGSRSWSHSRQFAFIRGRNIHLTGRPQPLRLQNDLYAFVLLVQEHLVPCGRVLEPHAVRDDEAWVNLPILYPIEQRTHIVLDVRLTCLDR